MAGAFFRTWCGSFLLGNQNRIQRARLSGARPPLELDSIQVLIIEIAELWRVQLRDFCHVRATEVAGVARLRGTLEVITFFGSASELWRVQLHDFSRSRQNSGVILTTIVGNAQCPPYRAPIMGRVDIANHKHHGDWQRLACMSLLRWACRSKSKSKS